MNTNLIIRICVVALVILGVIMGWNAIDKENPGMQLIYMIIVGVFGGLAGVKYVIPWIGDAMGTFFFSSGEQVQMDEGMKAVAKLAQGDYDGAIREYEKIARDKPEDAFPVAEIAKICSEKLDDPRRALAFLQSSLESKQWEQDAAAFLMFRMADLHAEKLDDHQAARGVLEQVIGTFPNTRHSANAHHKLREVEQAQFKAAMDQRLKGGGSQQS
ncbi:MAG: tetratricopeptide repeat protein [Verrucomicrobiaceae bacterium]|nr:tetratricopeptide repeat protein [Verrucomicrobiaceae bacterium]